MAFVAVSHWTSTEISDEMISTANEKCIPLIMRVGANGVQMVRTGELSLCVETLFLTHLRLKLLKLKLQKSGSN